MANDLFYAGTLEKMRSRLMALLKEDQDPRVLGQAAVLESYKYLESGGGKSYANWLKAQEEKTSGGTKAAAAEPARQERRKK